LRTCVRKRRRNPLSLSCHQRSGRWTWCRTPYLLFPRISESGDPFLCSTILRDLICSFRIEPFSGSFLLAGLLCSSLYRVLESLGCSECRSLFGRNFHLGFSLRINPRPRLSFDNPKRADPVQSYLSIF